MHSIYGLRVAAVLVMAAAYAQTQPKARAQQAPGQATAGQANAGQAHADQAMVDVVVQGKDGLPIRGLRPENFRLAEDKVPQTIVHVQEHSTLTPARKAPELPRMPPGTFTDYTPMVADDTLNILLLDALNTPVKNKSFIRNELRQYVKQAKPGTRIAILGLANHLILLQGFTSNPETLKSIVDHKLIPRSTSLRTNPTDSAADQQNLAEVVDANAPSMDQLAANMEEFEVQMGAMETQLRVHFTLDALNTLGRYLTAFPGRKNLIWVAGSFPIHGLAGSSGKRSGDAEQVDPDELRETARLLSVAQVAIYPVNAGSLMAPPVEATAKSVSVHAGKYGDALKKLGTSARAEHANMEQLALESGGRAFYDVSRLADAVGEAVEAGGNYYSLTYRPAVQREDGSVREVRVSVAGDDAGRGMQMAYRHETYAGDAAQSTVDSKIAATSGGTAADSGTASAYVRATMSRGAPAPQNLLFKVRVLPASATTESAVAPDNELDASVSPKGPFRRYDVDFVALAKEMTLSPTTDGQRTGKMELLVYVFDVDGRLLNGTGKTFTLKLTEANYGRFIQSVMEGHIEISVPSEKETFLRIGVRDVPSNKLGVVEVPTADVSHLAPAVYPAAPPAGEAVPMGAVPKAPATAPPTAPSTAPSTMPSTSQPPAAVPSMPPVPRAGPAR